MITPFTSPEVWSPQDLANTSWRMSVLDCAEQTAIIAQANRLVSQGDTNAGASNWVSCNPAALRNLIPRVAHIRPALQRGVGFMLMRGFPFANMSS